MRMFCCLYMFVAEYRYRIVKAENKIAYVTSFFGVVDLIAILPILIHAAASVRVVRLLRVLRILRLLKTKRYSEALDRYRKALKLIAAEAALFTGVACVFVLGFAFLIYEFEHGAQPDVYSNIFDSIWWAVISLTSVGYRDVYPVTIAGRMLTLAMVLTGMGIVAVPTALLASALSGCTSNGRMTNPSALYGRATGSPLHTPHWILLRLASTHSKYLHHLKQRTNRRLSIVRPLESIPPGYACLPLRLRLRYPQ